MVSVTFLATSSERISFDHNVFFFQSRNAKTASKRAAKSYERPGLSEEEIEEIREAFNLFDTDGSGMHEPSFLVTRRM